MMVLGFLVQIFHALNVELLVIAANNNAHICTHNASTQFKIVVLDWLHTFDLQVFVEFEFLYKSSFTFFFFDSE